MANPIKYKVKPTIHAALDSASIQVDKSISKEEQQLNVWIPRDLMKQLKVKGIETESSLKEMVVKAIIKFL